jgi:hypothetical protein
MSSALCAGSSEDRLSENELIEPKIILPRDLWGIQRLPQVRDPTLAPAAFTTEQANDFQLFMQVLQLVDAPGGGRRSWTGINRAAQFRWPGRGLNIQLISDIVESWLIGGWRGVADMIAQGKVDFPDDAGGLSYCRVEHELKAMVIKRVSQLMDQEEVFAGGRLVVDWTEGREPLYRFYRVTAETNYGTFKFAMVDTAVPEWPSVQPYCIWHTRADPGAG